MSGSVSLKCTHCSNPLEIAPEIEHFFCGNCGKPFFVRRGGGIIYLDSKLDQDHLSEQTAYKLQLNVQASEIEKSKGVENQGGMVTKQIGDYEIRQQQAMSLVPETAPVQSEQFSSQEIDTNIFGDQGCYRCNKQAVGECAKDNSYYCDRHGYGGYCEACIDRTRYVTPVSIRIIGWIFYLLAGTIFLLGGLLVLGAGWVFTQLTPALEFFGQVPGSELMIFQFMDQSMASIEEWIIPLLVAFLCVPMLLIMFGRLFNSGSEIAKWIVILLSVGLIFLSVYLPFFLIFGLGIPLLIYKERHWYKIRKMIIPFPNHIPDRVWR